jgi:hypothetical protein
MASVFENETTQQSPVKVVRESLDVDSNGTVSFRTRKGKGSGKAVEIPGSLFSEFVDLMIATRDSREDLARKQKEVEADGQ